MDRETRDLIEETAKQSSIHTADRMRRDMPNMHDIEKMIEKGIAEAMPQAVEAAAVRAAETAVSKTLISFGLDPTNRNEIMRDFLFLNDFRKLMGSGKRHVFLAVIAVFCTIVFAALWAYVKLSVTK